MKKNNSEKEYKHIILVSIDTLRADCITAVAKSPFLNKFAPSKDFQTTSLDWLIKNGTFFNYCITAAPYTTASHAAYFTGCWPKNNSVYEFYNRRISRPTIFQIASKLGWKTIFQTDFPIILGKNIGFTKSVDEYFIEDENGAFDCLQSESNQKTFSFFHFGGVHYPYGFHNTKFAPKDYPEKITSLEKQLEIDSDELPDDILDESYRDKKEKDLLLRYKKIVDVLYSKKDYDTLHRLYVEGIDYFMKHRFDRFFNKLIKFVDKNNALLVVFADHGENWDDDSRGHSNSISPGVLRVPLIFYGKGIPKGRMVDSLVRTIDLTPTLAEILSAKGSFDGKSLDCFFKQEKDDSRIGITQVWRNGNKKKIFEHQQKILQGDHMIKPLKTRLEKEVIYKKNDTLRRFYDAQGIMGAELFLYDNSTNSLRLEDNILIKEELSSQLDSYNNSFEKKKGKATRLTERIASELESLGYRV